MTQAERREFLIKYLLAESKQYAHLQMPAGKQEQERLLRALLNIRMPQEVTEEFLNIQDEYLLEEIAGKGITDYKGLTPIEEGLYLWQGDITLLKVGAIVNAANSQMLGCFAPNHACIDNCIHTFAGIQLRKDCYDIMQKQGHEEATGTAKITSAYNLPADYVIHTVGPIVEGELTAEHEELLAACYLSCLQLAEEKGVKSIAFCCISTGVFMFPNKRAAEIAIKTVKEYKQDTGSAIEVIFNVFKEQDYQIYRELLG